MPEADRAAVLGDLEEEFRRRVGTGRGRARRWYWRQTVTSLRPNLHRRLASTPVTRDRSRVLASIGQDLRFALRILRHRPLVTAAAGFSLAAGIGLSAGVFSLLEAAVIRPLPLHDPDALRVVLEQRERSVNHGFTYPGFTAFREIQQSFTDIVAFAPVTAAIGRPDGSDVAEGELVSGSFFPTLGPRIVLGRGLTDSDLAGPADVIVLSHAEWRRQFGDATDLTGRAVRLNGRAFAVVGVTGASFRGMQVGMDARFWAPLSAQPVLDPFGGRSLLTMPTVSWLTVMGRLAPGIDEDRATAELNATATSLTQVRDGAPPPRFFLAPGAHGDSNLQAQIADPLRLLLAASLLVLVVACANVAGLLLARTNDRRREIALRTALGASRWRIARLLLLESLLLGVACTAVGLLAALWVAPLSVPLFARFGEPVTLDVQLNWRVAVFAAGTGLATTIAASLAPVLRSWRRDAGHILGEGGRLSTTGTSALRWRRGLVVAQFALTLGLVASAGLLVQTLLNLESIPTGLDVDGVALVGVNPEAVQYDGPRARDYLARVEEQVAALPGVRAVGFGQVIPLGFGGSRMTVEVPGYTPEPDEDMELNYNVVTPGYFDALGIELLDGRGFDGRGATGSVLSVVVNETMARRYWPGRSVGRTFVLGGGTPTLEIIGVVRDVKYRTIREDPRPSFYLSSRQLNDPKGGVVHVRTAGDPAPMLDLLRRTIADVDPTVPITALRTLRRQLSRNVNRERATMIVGLALGAAALLLSAVGLFGAMATLVGGRTRELGVRMALGAVPGQLARLVLGQGLSLAAAGALLGLALAFWLGHLIEARLYGVGPFDAVSAIAAVALLSAVALVAAWLPARRAARVDPVNALRVE